MTPRKALFLDRDGVINVNHGYVCTPERTDFIDGIFELCRRARQRDYLLVVVTNQAGIARGYFSEMDFQAYMDWMRQVFVDEGAQLDAVYYCPHHPDAGAGAYRRQCDCRKPAPGMIVAAQRDLDIDLGQSVLVGDKASDLEAGRRAGVSACILMHSARDGADARTKLNAADLQQVIHRIEG